MDNIKIPLELVSNIISILILLGIFFKYYQYKKKLDVLKGLDVLKTKNQLTLEDKEFINKNYKDYSLILKKEEERLKLFNPIFILIAGVLIAFLSFQEAMIHLNVIVVAYIYLQVNRIHIRNFVSFLKELKNEEKKD
ncbi:hypothetical protein [Halarcobacter sp.]|uniref:hypothetical protein n=1 Tax=Halarcobacter sp. TaxID=2321133 RepID=UPI002AA95F01|nr:hypothetical protein [Halarcobacter sp.]